HVPAEKTLERPDDRPRWILRGNRERLVTEEQLAGTLRDDARHELERVPGRVGEGYDWVVTPITGRDHRVRRSEVDPEAHRCAPCRVGRSSASPRPQIDWWTAVPAQPRPLTCCGDQRDPCGHSLGRLLAPLAAVRQKTNDDNVTGRNRSLSDSNAVTPSIGTPS